MAMIRCDDSPLPGLAADSARFRSCLQGKRRTWFGLIFARSGAGSRHLIPAGAALLLPGWSSTMEFRQGQEFVPGGDSGSGGGPVEFRPGQAFFPGGGFLTANAGEFVPPSRGADVRVPEFRPVSSRSLACGASCYSAAAARALPGCWCGALVPGSNCGRSRCRALGRIAPGHACLRA